MHNETQESDALEVANKKGSMPKGADFMGEKFGYVLITF
jgi:hypothetical protein